MSTMKSKQSLLTEKKTEQQRSKFENEEQFRFSAKNNSNNGKFLFGSLMGLATVFGFGISAVSAEEKKKEVDYEKVKKEIAALLQKNENLGPTFIRLAWHASGTYSKLTKDGGSNYGSIRHDPERSTGANAGLGIIMDMLEPIVKANPGLSHGDLYTLAGVVAVKEMSGPVIPWKSGRIDASDNSQCAVGRLPDADKGTKGTTIKHIRDVFYRMGFDDKEIVALMGAHTFGRCHTNASGYSGPWTNAPTMFSNSYYVELTENEWKVKQWNGPMQYEDKSGTLMMLPADMYLLNDPSFSKYVKLYAKDEAQFTKDFAAAFGKLLALGVPGQESKGGW